MWIYGSNYSVKLYIASGMLCWFQTRSTLSFLHLHHQLISMSVITFILYSLYDNMTVVSFRFCQNQGGFIIIFFFGYYANEAVSSSRILESCRSKLVINTSPAPAVTSYWSVCQTRMYLGNRRKLSRHGLVDHSLTSAQHCGLILHIFKG